MRILILCLIFIGLPSCAPSSQPSTETLAEDASSIAPDVAGHVETPQTIDMRKPATEPAELRDDVPDEGLGIFVVGRIAGDDGAATLRLPNGKEVTFRRGDEIISGVTLKAIDRNFVLIDIKGQEKKLPVSKGWTPGKTSWAGNTLRGKYQVKADGSVSDSTGKIIGRVNANGDIIALNGSVIGRVNANGRTR